MNVHEAHPPIEVLQLQICVVVVVGGDLVEPSVDHGPQDPATQNTKHRHICPYTHTHITPIRAYTQTLHLYMQLRCLGGSVGRATALKAGGHGFESHLSSIFFYENRKEGSQVCCLVCLWSLSSHAKSRYALLMMAKKPETVLYKAPTVSLLLASHGGISSWISYCEALAGMGLGAWWFYYRCSAHDRGIGAGGQGGQAPPQTQNWGGGRCPSKVYARRNCKCSVRSQLSNA